MPSTHTANQPFSKLPAFTLENQASMNAEEFHALYEAHSGDSRFELIDGVVHMAPPLNDPHGKHDISLLGVLWMHAGHTPGTAARAGVSVRLDAMTEVQPDAHLRVLPENGGQSKVIRNERGEETWLQGAPELVGETANSSRSVDFNRKLDLYQRAGVREYIVLDVRAQEMHWFELPSKQELIAESDGVIRSRAFPGLWIDPKALMAGDVARCVQVLYAASQSEEHQVFCGELAGWGG